MFRSITPLLRTDAARIEDHLLRLSAEDRSLRFAAGLVTGETVRRDVAAIPFERDLVLGLVSQRGSVFGLGHGCVFTAGGRSHVEAAFSIDAAWRGRGLAISLMHALTACVADRADAAGTTIPAVRRGICRCAPCSACRHDAAPRGGRDSRPWLGQSVAGACRRRREGACSLLNRPARSGPRAATMRDGPDRADDRYHRRCGRRRDAAGDRTESRDCIHRGDRLSRSAMATLI